ncbi:hypothetical protein C8R47DRAFT_1076424 [Mycena vitilis]|nr:hypothetical protein C8R47DRAFT_1076424 [Mycena vitilis]
MAMVWPWWKKTQGVWLCMNDCACLFRSFFPPACSANALVLGWPMPGSSRVDPPASHQAAIEWNELPGYRAAPDEIHRMLGSALTSGPPNVTYFREAAIEAPARRSCPGISSSYTSSHSQLIPASAVVPG